MTNTHLIKRELKEFLIALAAAVWIFRGVACRAEGAEFLPFVIGYVFTGLIWFVPKVWMWRWRSLAYWQLPTKRSVVLRIIAAVEAL